MPPYTVKAVDRGVEVTFSGVLLSDLVRLVDTPFVERFRKSAGKCYVLAEAVNGDRALFAWAELASTFMDKRVYVVTKRNGSALMHGDGPFRLVEPNDTSGERWIRQLQTVTVQIGELRA